MAKPKKDNIKGKIKLQIKAGQATPAPPLGPILGQNGIPIKPFCDEFNEKTKDLQGAELPVEVTIFKDNSFRMNIKQPTIAGMLKQAVGIQKASGTPNTKKVGTVSLEKATEIAEKKLPDLNTKKLDSAVNTVKGVAQSMGIQIK